MQSVIYGAEQSALVSAWKTRLTGGKMHLLKSTIALVPNPVLADLTALECSFDGATAKATPTLPNPYIDAQRNGWSLNVPTLTWEVTGATDLTQNILGLWMEDSAGPPAVPVCLVVFQNPWPMQQVGAGAPIDVTFNFFGSAPSPVVSVLLNGMPWS